MGDRGSLERAIRESECDIIYNCAGIYSWWKPKDSASASPGELTMRSDTNSRSTDGERAFHSVNVEGVRNWVEAALSVSQERRAVNENSKPLRLVHVSTVLAFGRVESSDAGAKGLTPETAFCEDDEPGRTTSKYAQTKQEGDRVFEQLIGGAVNSSGLVIGSLVYLACCLGRDPKLVDERRDVMRLSDLAHGRVPATVASPAVFTYIDVGDAAEGIIRAGEWLRIRETSLKRAERFFLGDQRLATAGYYSLVAELAGRSPPAFELPFAGVALAWAHVTSWWARSSPLSGGKQPQAPPDLVRTATNGTFLFDCSKAAKELSMTHYRPVRESLQEGVSLVLSHEGS